MTAITPAAGPDVAALRSRIRAAQHARSFPLLVIGILLINYGVGIFAPTPTQWRYAAPLAFVMIWALLKVNETRVGVGTGRADYLVAAAFVFAATNIVIMRPIADQIDFRRVQGVWIMIVGVTLVVLGAVVADRVLVLAGIIATAPGVNLVFTRDSLGIHASPSGFFVQPWAYVYIACAGAV